MRGVGSLRNLTGNPSSGSTKKSGPARRRRSASGAALDEDDFALLEADAFKSPTKLKGLSSNKQSKSAPLTPTDSSPKMDLRNFFRTMSAPGALKTSENSSEPFKTPQKPSVGPSSVSSPALLSPPKPRLLKTSFDDAILIIDSSSDEETEKTIPVRNLITDDKENLPTPPAPISIMDDDDDENMIVADQQSKNTHSTSSASAEKPKPNYYLKNFTLILETVLLKDGHLIVPEELAIINKFKGISDDAQRLFIRLIYRRGPWFQVSKLVYREINDVSSAINELITHGLAVEPQSPVEVLHLLSTQQLRNLLKGSKTSSSLSSPSHQTPREALLDQARKLIQNQRTLFGRPITPKELGRCIKILDNVQVIIKRLHRLFFLSQTEDQTALTLVHLGRIAFPTYILQGVDVDDGLEGKPFPVASIVPETFNNPYALVLLEQKTEETQPNMDQNLVTNEESQDGIAQSESLGAIEIAEEEAKAPTNSFRPRWKIEANLTILNHVGFSSVFPDRQSLEAYEEAMLKAIEVAELLGEDLDGTGAAGTTGEITGSMSSMLSSGYSNSGPKWGRASRLNDRQIERILEMVDEAVDNLKKSPKLENREITFGEKRQVFDYEKNLFLRRFTAKWLHASIAWIGVSLLERQRNYAKAVEVLKALLATEDVCLGKRGEWWLRLGYDLAHQKDLEAALDSVVSGIKDSHIRPQQRLALYSKLKILLKAKARKDSNASVADEEIEELIQDDDVEILAGDDDFESEQKMSTPKQNIKKRKRRSSSGAPTPKRRKSDVSPETSPTKDPPMPQGLEPFSIKEPIARIIQARPLLRGSASTPSFGKSLFIGFEGESEVGVEELALQFYKLKEKFSDGSHCEGGPLAILFGLIMWDIVFDASVPFVFQTPVQDAPLDFGTEDFYHARASAIEERLLLLGSDGDDNILLDMLDQAHSKWHGRVCRVVNWTRWSLEELKSIAQCIGGKALASIFRRFATDFRYSHSGLPDLLLWDVPTKRAKFVEVKGPRDRLSDKQRIWIDYMMNAGIEVEVLYVREKLREGEVDDSQDLVVEKPVDEPRDITEQDNMAVDMGRSSND